MDRQFLTRPRNGNFNLLVRIKFLKLFLNSSLKKNEQFPGLNKALLVLDWMTGAHREDCLTSKYRNAQVIRDKLN